MIFGFEHGAMKSEIELINDYPASVAAMLLNNEIDVGLVPVAIIPTLKQAHIISDYCIGAEADVASVCLFSDVPVQQIKRVLLDYQSRTSVKLVKILLKEYWNIEPELVEATEDFRDLIGGTTAAVVIGDRAFEQRKISAYSFDLAAAWKAHTGLPFVFAAWVSNKPLPANFIEAFNNANKIGLNNLEAVIAEHPYTLFDLKKYFTQNISYTLTAEKRKGMALFLDKIKQYGL